jgi:hypothetical protein
MKTSSGNTHLWLTALIFFSSLLVGWTQSGQAWPAGVREIMQFELTNASDETVIAYVKSTNRRYKLNDSMIIMLKQQGFSDAVLNAMIANRPAPKHPKPEAKEIRAVRPAPRYYYPGNASLYPYYWYPPVGMSYGRINNGNYWGTGWHGNPWNYPNNWH